MCSSCCLGNHCFFSSPPHLPLLHQGMVKFIDYEYADYNYQAFDIGNHFNEFAGKVFFLLVFRCESSICLQICFMARTFIHDCALTRDIERTVSGMQNPRPVRRVSSAVISLFLPFCRYVAREPPLLRSCPDKLPYSGIKASLMEQLCCGGAF